GTITTANPTYTASELAYQLKDAGASYLITNVDLLPAALEAANEANIPNDRILLLPTGNSDNQEFRYIQDVYSVQYPPVVTFTKEEIWNQPAYLCYSSGTTGRSKGVETTHRNLVSNVLQFVVFQRAMKEVRPDDVWTGVLPFYHIYGLCLSLHVAAYYSNAVVVVPKFELESFLSYLAKYNVGIAHIVPPIAVAFAKSPVVDKFKFPKLYGLMSGAAPLGSDLSALIIKRLGIPILQGYGMTELSPLCTITPIHAVVDGASGLLAPLMEARLVSPETGKDVASGKEGELWVRGPNVMKGYHNNEKATKETIDEQGWLHTGDIAVVDKKGYFYIVDRIKELIKYKGLQVAPAELEAYLLTHPAIADAAVIPRPDENAGELPRAYVVLKPGAKVTELEVQKFIEGKVAQHKRLRGGVAFIDAIPKAASGKILRRVLRDLDAAERKAAAGPEKAKL
ncbi:hypothetical protein HDU76_006320, partial [Blyttiomyces sp. JEL0837]